VIPASEVRMIRSVRDAQRQVGAQLAITGSVLRDVQSIRLTLNLVDAGTLRQLRSTTLDKPLAAITELQDGVVREVADLLKMELNPEAIGALSVGGTTVPSAYDLYLRGTGLVMDSGKAESLGAAIDNFQRAIDKDPTFALAYAGLAEAYWLSYLLPEKRDVAYVERARQNCERALQLREQLIGAHVTLSRILNGTGDRDMALQAAERALQLDPLSADGYLVMADAYRSMGNLKEAEATYRKAIAIRPDSCSAYHNLGVFYYHQGRYKDAEIQFRRMLDLAPDNLGAIRNLGAMYYANDRYDEAAQTFDRQLSIQPSAHIYSNSGTVHFYLGHYARAVDMFEKAIQHGGEKDYQVWGNLADGYRWSPGNAEKAPAAFEKAMQLVTAELRVNPKDAEAHCDFALYLAKTGNFNRALQEIKSAFDCDSSDVYIWGKAATVYELAGRREEALRAVQRALEGKYSARELANEPELIQLRKDPRYKAFLKTDSAGLPSRS
jgi:eukaryotic-like serine/threonine-protein kinase